MSKTLLEARPLRRFIASTIDAIVEASNKRPDLEIEQEIELVARYEWDEDDGLRIGLDAKGPVSGLAVGAGVDVSQEVERLGDGHMIYRLRIRKPGAAS